MSSPEKDLPNEISYGDELTRIWESLPLEDKQRALERIRIGPSPLRHLHDVRDAILNGDPLPAYPPQNADILPDIQDPEVMPWGQQVEAESAAMGSIAQTGPIHVSMPLRGDYVLEAAPWPPLSRQQVVELHEALVTFCSEWAQSWSLTPEHLELKQRGAGARLAKTLLSLGIGTPLTEEEIQEVVAKVQDPEGFACLDERTVDPKTFATSPLGRKNCGTCRNCNLPYSMACAIAAEGTSTRRWRDGLSMDALSEEKLLAQLTSTAGHCPGWEAKP